MMLTQQFAFLREIEKLKGITRTPGQARSIQLLLSRAELPDLE